MPVAQRMTERQDMPSGTGSVELLADRLRESQPRWASLTLDDRISALTRLADEIDCRRDAIVSALVEDTGRLAASEMEAGAVRALVDRWRKTAVALLTESPETATGQDGVCAITQRVAYPLVGVIAPWNSPLGLSMIDAIPALVAGCAVIAKPSEMTPRFVAPLVEAIAASPQVSAVFAMLSGDGKIGAEIVDAVDAVCFTGSVETGRRVAVAAAARLIPAFLELGGKDAAIVLAGADLARAAGGITWSGTFNSGQLCHSIERVYVERAVAGKFIDLLVTRMATKQLAWPDVRDGAIGRFIDPAQGQVVEAQLADAYRRGARALTGGTIERHGGHWWCPTTVLVDVNHAMAVMREETFGPVVPVMTVDSAEAAVALANDTRFGLSASVWGPESTAIAIGRRLNAGAISINDASLSSIVHDVEKNAFGVSGLGGSRMGAAGITRFLRRKALLVARIDGDDPWW